MKIKIFFIIICIRLLTDCNLVISQNITNTLGTNGTFTVKDGSTNYMTLSQSTGNISLFRNFELGGLTNSTTTQGVITKNGVRFIHNFKGPGWGSNTFIGLNSGNFTFTFGGSNTAVGEYSLYSLTQGSDNSAFGTMALYSNTIGYSNSAFGSSSLQSNISGNVNCAFGENCMFSNMTGAGNSAFGYNSLTGNTSGNYNSAFGLGTLSSNISGNDNSAFGTSALASSTGENNSAFGMQCLALCSNGALNSAFGSRALYFLTTGKCNSSFGAYNLYNCTGSFNTAFGDSAGFNLSSGSNNVIVGYNAQVPSITGSNQVRIGNTSITYAGVQVAWTITSDRKWKRDITDSKLGLGFLSKLRPVSYTRNNDESGKTEYGFIAQEVEEALVSSGAENTGMITVDDEGTYNMRYNDLLAPMVKAIQELKAENDELKNNNKKLSAEVESLKSMSENFSKLEKLVNELTSAKNTLLTGIK